MPLDRSRIRQLRLKLGLSQDEAAQLAGLSGRQQWNNIETGDRPNPSIETVEKIAKALGVKVDDLLKD